MKRHFKKAALKLEVQLVSNNFAFLVIIATLSTFLIVTFATIYSKLQFFNLKIIKGKTLNLNESKKSKKKSPICSKISNKITAVQRKSCYHTIGYIYAATCIAFRYAFHQFILLLVELQEAYTVIY